MYFPVIDSWFYQLLWTFAGSIEEIVESLVKSWEMEASHKTKLEDWKTVDHEEYNIKVGFVDEGSDVKDIKWNEPVRTHDAVTIGNYNVLMANCPAYKYNKAKATDIDNHWHDSHEIFRSGFTTFPWELLEVKKQEEGKFHFTWRHWGYWGVEGRAKKLVESIGDCIATLSSKTGKIASLEVTYDPSKFLKDIGQSITETSTSDVEVKTKSALAEQLGKEGVKELEHDFVPEGMTVETIWTLDVIKVMK